jgi:uncharacterized membrane protein
MLEMAAVTFDGAHGAEKALSDLRTSRQEPWLGEVSVIEHDVDGRFAVKAKNPSVTESHAGSGAAIGGLTGVFIGLIGGPLGLLFWGTLGVLTGGAIGVSGESAFKPMVDDLEDRLPPDASMLVLVGETATIESFVSTLGATEDRLVRAPLTSDQAEELSKAAASAPAS